MLFSGVCEGDMCPKRGSMRVTEVAHSIGWDKSTVSWDLGRSSCDSRLIKRGVIKYSGFAAQENSLASENIFLEEEESIRRIEGERAALGDSRY